MRRRLEQLRERPQSEDPLAEELPVHVLPEEPRKRSGPFGVSAVLHVLVLLALVLAPVWAPKEPAPKPPDLVVALQERLQTEPGPARAPRPPRAAPPEPARTRPPAKAPERRLIPPPPVPKLIPPPVPLPPPKRMGELVPVPHLPAPGTVPPEQRNAAPKGPPSPQEQSEKRVPSGDPQGTNTTDAGSGARIGAGSGDNAGGGLPGRPGAVRGGRTGRLLVPMLGGGPWSERREQEREATGGGRRKGLNLNLPSDRVGHFEFAFDDKDYDWNDYYSQMYWAIWRAWTNKLQASELAFDRIALRERNGICSRDSPRAGSLCTIAGDKICGHEAIRSARDNMVIGYTPGDCVYPLKGTTVVRFVIERSGAVSSIQVLDPSQYPLLDEAAQDGIKEASLPRLPQDFPKDSEGVTGMFIVDVEYHP